MEIVHHIAKNITQSSNILQILEKSNIKYRLTETLQPTSKLLSFDILETNTFWEYIQEWAKTNDAIDMFDAIFSDEEVLAAKWLRLIRTNIVGYPQPENKWKENFRSYCTCGAHGAQIKSFRIKKEPGMKRQDFISINWAFPQFCTNKVVETFRNEKVKGFEEWDIIIHRKNIASENVKQLYVPHVSKPGLLSDRNFIKEKEWERCQKCGEILYSHHLRGIMYLKRESVEYTDTDFLQIYEWLGRKGVARREYLVSQKVASIVIKNKWKGVRFKVVELVG